MSGRYTLSTLSTIVFSAFAIAGVPADPTITARAVLPRQNNAQFIGWVEYSGSWYSETCNAGLTWYQDGKYGQCCPVTLASCYAPTACASGSLIYPYSDVSSTRTIACTANFNNPLLSICNTAFIFENLSDSNPKTDIICGSQSVNWSYYRKIPASATEVSSAAPLSIPQVVSTALTSPNGTKNSTDGGSKVWIAGAVVGPVVGLALIGALVWFLLRRRKNKGTAPQQGSATMGSIHSSQPPVGVAGFTDAKPQFAQPQQPYGNQSAYAAQQGYASPPISPGLQFSDGTVPYNAPGSPPPQQTYYGNDGKPAYASAALGGVSELVGETSGPTSPAAHTASNAHTAELGGQSGPGGSSGLFGPSELPATSSNPKTTI